jgi:hypothetical protein
VTRLAAAGALLVLLAAPLAAQAPTATPSPSPPADAPRCLGLAFGRWTPALDLAAAGHASPSGATPQAPNGRDWAAAIEAGRDTTLMLFPAWWPAGVHVHVPASRPGRDTVRATATALVADGRVRAPSATVLMWTVRCDRAAGR